MHIRPFHLKAVLLLTSNNGASILWAIQRVCLGDSGGLGFVSGHGFNHAAESQKQVGLQPLRMARPARNARPDAILSPARTFFATTKTSMGRPLLQSERHATLFIDVLRSYVAAGKFQVHDFVVMPDHVHLLLTELKRRPSNYCHPDRGL